MNKDGGDTPKIEAEKGLDEILTEILKFSNTYGRDGLEIFKAKKLLLAWRDKAVVAARIDELNRMQIRVVDDPDDDTDLFWYRTYTMPEFEARLNQLNGAKDESGS